MRSSVAPVETRQTESGCVVPLTVNGQRATNEQVQTVRRALAKVPARFLNRWRERGGHIEVMPELTAEGHPAWPDCKAHAFYRKARELVVLPGGGHDLANSTLHEICHVIDVAGPQRLSDSPAFVDIASAPPGWYREAIGDAPTPNRQELFAELGAAYLSDPTNDALPWSVREFFSGVIASNGHSGSSNG
jgi:hypothetical protein